MSALCTLYLVAAIGFLQYLKGSLDFGLLFCRSPTPFTIKAYSDADWAGCADRRRSTTGLCVFLVRISSLGLLRNYPPASCSNAEVEYQSLTRICAETTWVSNLLIELQLSPPFPISLLCDSLSATYMASNPVFHARTKHIDLDSWTVGLPFHLETHTPRVTSCSIQFVPSPYQLVDIFTIGLHKHRFQHLRFNLVCPRQPSLRGSVKL